MNLNSFAPHPIHIHLINYQIQKQWSLRMITAEVSYYQVDFYLKLAEWNAKCQAANPELKNFGHLQEKWRKGKPITE